MPFLVKMVPRYWFSARHELKIFISSADEMANSFVLKMFITVGNSSVFFPCLRRSSSIALLWPNKPDTITFADSPGPCNSFDNGGDFDRTQSFSLYTLIVDIEGRGSFTFASPAAFSRLFGRARSDQ